MNENAHSLLLDAIEGVYSAFSTYSRHEAALHLKPSLNDDEMESLRTIPLKELSPLDTHLISEEALIYMGSALPFKYLLPRLLELFASNERATSMNIALEWGGFNSHKWQEWQENERSAINVFFRELWEATIVDYPYPLESSAKETFEGIALVVDDIQPFLRYWLDNDSISALRHLTEYVDHVFPDLVYKKGLLWPLGDERPDAEAKIITWLKDPHLEEEIATAYMRYSAEDFAEELSNASDQLALLRK